MSKMGRVFREKNKDENVNIYFSVSLFSVNKTMKEAKLFSFYIPCSYNTNDCITRINE